MSKILTPQELRALSWAVGEAKTWRGAMVGDQLKAFDERIKLASKALEKIRRLSKETGK